MTSAFVDGAQLMAGALGAAGYGFAVIDHPIASATSEQLAGRARAVLEQARALLSR